VKTNIMDNLGPELVNMELFLRYLYNILFEGYRTLSSPCSLSYHFT
jgi:hypothetical protein